MKGDNDWYEDGQKAAQEAQEALAQGQTFEQISKNLNLVHPEDAAGLRDLYMKADPLELGKWWDGYLSRWD